MSFLSITADNWRDRYSALIKLIKEQEIINNLHSLLKTDDNFQHIRNMKTVAMLVHKFILVAVHHVIGMFNTKLQ